MIRPSWDAARYLVYAEERGRPFVDLLGRIDAETPARVVDVGCGPGNLTTLLQRRWPDADVLGIDSSTEMISVARSASVDGVRFEVGDLRDWAAAEPVDVLVSNATLQWLPEHLGLLPTLVAQVRAGGWFAFGVPGNFTAPSHVLLRELSSDTRFAPFLDEISPRPSYEPEEYLVALADLGCSVDAWETTYLHVLGGPDPVFDWISGTGARPMLQALPEGLRAEFTDEYKALLRAAYPPGPHGTVLPFRRIFLVARVLR